MPDQITVTFYPTISLSLNDITIPGVQVELDPTEADSLFPFEESAFFEADAWESNTDIGENYHELP